MRNTKGWLKITRGNFTRKPTEVNFPSADWLSYLRTQLTVFVGGVSLRSRKIFSALFSWNNFFTRRGHFKELQVKGNLFDCSQILTVASFAYKQEKGVSEFFISKYFFSRAIFVRSVHIFLILFQKCSVTFHWNWIWQIADTFFFSALASEAEEREKREKQNSCG